MKQEDVSKYELIKCLSAAKKQYLADYVTVNEDRSVLIAGPSGGSASDYMVLMNALKECELANRIQFSTDVSFDISKVFGSDIQESVSDTRERLSQKIEGIIEDAKQRGKEKGFDVVVRGIAKPDTPLFFRGKFMDMNKRILKGLPDVETLQEKKAEEKPVMMIKNKAELAKIQNYVARYRRKNPTAGPDKIKKAVEKKFKIQIPD